MPAIAVVTGAARGLGRTIAARGHEVLLTDGAAAEDAARAIGQGAWAMGRAPRLAAGAQGGSLRAAGRR